MQDIEAVLVGSDRRSRRDAILASLWTEHHDDRARLDPVVEVDHVLVGQPDAAGGYRLSDILRLVGPVDAEHRILAAGEKINPAGAHRILPAPLGIIGKRAEPLLLTFGRRPTRPFFLAADL